MHVRIWGTVEGSGSLTLAVRTRHTRAPSFKTQDRNSRRLFDAGRRRKRYAELAGELFQSIHHITVVRDALQVPLLLGLDLLLAVNQHAGRAVRRLGRLEVGDHPLHDGLELGWRNEGLDV